MHKGLKFALCFFISPFSVTLIHAADSPVPGDRDLAFGEFGDGVGRPHGTGMTRGVGWNVIPTSKSLYGLGEVCPLGEDPCRNVALFKLDSNGAFDTSFGPDGTGVVSLPDLRWEGSAVLRTDDQGRIYVLYQYEEPPTATYRPYYGVVIRRFLPDGHRDPSFTPVTVPIQIRSETSIGHVIPLAFDIINDGQDKIVLVAYRNLPSPEILRIHSDLAGRDLWPEGGVIPINERLPSNLFHLGTVLSNSNVVIAYPDETSNNWLVRKINPDGEWDTSFANNGQLLIDADKVGALLNVPSETFLHADISHVESDDFDRVYLNGTFCCEYNPTWNDYSDWMGTFRIKSNGDIDTAFGEQGTGLAVEKFTLQSSLPTTNFAVDHLTGRTVVSAFRKFNDNGFLNSDSFSAWFDEDGRIDSRFSMDPAGVRRGQFIYNGKFLPSGDVIAANVGTGTGIKKISGILPLEDPTPDPFPFDEKLTYPSTLVESPAITPTGFNVAVTASVDVGELRVNDGEWEQGPIDFMPGDTISVRHVTKSDEGETLATTLTLGGTSGVFTSRVADITPAAFDFTDINKVEPEQRIESDVIEISGIELPVKVSVDQGEFRVNDGEWQTAPTTAAAGDTVTLALEARAQPGEERVMQVTVGTLIDAFSVTTRSAQEPAPEPEPGPGESGGGASFFLVLAVLPLLQWKWQVNKA